MASLPRSGLVSTILVGVFGPLVALLVRGATSDRRVSVGEGEVDRFVSGKTIRILLLVSMSPSRRPRSR